MKNTLERTGIYGSNRWPRVQKKVRRIKKLFKDRGIALPPNVTFFITKRKRGWAYYLDGNRYVIMIPERALAKGKADYLDYYFIHEATHVASNYYEAITGHTMDFYRYFYKVCPPRYWHWELDYMKTFSRFLRKRGYEI